MSAAEELDIQLERITPERVAELYEALHESMDDLNRIGFSHPKRTIEEVEEGTKQSFKEWDLDKAYGFFIVNAPTNQLLGVVVLKQINRPIQMADLSGWVRSSRSGQGIMTKAAKLAIIYGIEELALRRIEMVVKEDNKPSLRVVEKLGAVREGLLRNRLLIQGTSYDAYIHSIIPEDIEETNAA